MRVKSLCLGYSILFTGFLAIPTFSSITYSIKIDQNGGLIQLIDREQLEMQHDEN